MAHFIYTLPDYALFALISLICVAFSIIGVILFQHFLSLKFRESHNDFTSYASVTISTMYTILIGFCVLFEFENMNKAVEVERQEANQVAAIYRTATIFPQPNSQKVQTLLKNYTNVVINNEWTAMASDQRVGDAGIKILNQLFQEVNSLRNNKQISEGIVDETLKEINDLFSYRYDRIAMMDRRIGNDVWFVIILGTFMTFLVHCIYGGNRRYHIATMVVIALVIASAIYLLVSLDRPYLGEFSVKPVAFKNVLSDMNK